MLSATFSTVTIFAVLATSRIFDTIETVVLQKLAIEKTVLVSLCIITIIKAEIDNEDRFGTTFLYHCSYFSLNDHSDHDHSDLRLCKIHK